ncbi:MAG: hypothetical protein ABSF71_10920 [Terriglobia bacterium]
MKTCFCGILISLSACCLSMPWMAYGQQPMGEDIGRYAMEQKAWPIVGKVKTAQGDPVRGATVIVAPLIALGPRVLTTDALGEFHTQFVVNVRQDHEFGVTLSAKKKGFQTAHGYADFDLSGKPWTISLTLRGPDDDLNQLSPADLISGLAPKLKQLGPAEGLAEKSAKDYARGLADFLDHNNPERAVPLLSKVLANNPTCIGCRTMLGLAEMGWCDWDEAQNTFIESVNATLHDRTKGRPEPLVAYGTWLNWQHETEKAEAFFQEALKFAPEDPLALQELGRTILALQQPEAANPVLKRALAAGAGTEARLLYIESCLGDSKSDEAAAEMNRYLSGRDVKTMPIRVRQVFASVQNRKKVESLFAKNKPEKNQDHIDFLQHPPASLVPGLVPAKDQEQLSSILEGVGKMVEELVKTYPNTMSLEVIQQEKLSRKGVVGETQTQKFRYLCIAPHEREGPSLTEYRADLAGTAAIPKGLSEGFMLTSGFTSAEFIFHPMYRPQSTFRFLGRQDVNGRNTLVVAFAQIPGKARFTGDFRNGNTVVTTLTQGLAWIDPANYQIIRFHTDLLAPLPEIRLQKESLNIDFNEVHFTHVRDALWLPQKVSVTLDWNGSQFRNQHDYSKFEVFNVDATEKIGKPKTTVESTQDPKESTISQ